MAALVLKTEALVDTYDDTWLHTGREGEPGASQHIGQQLKR